MERLSVQLSSSLWELSVQSPLIGFSQQWRLFQLCTSKLFQTLPATPFQSHFHIFGYLLQQRPHFSVLISFLVWVAITEYHKWRGLWTTEIYFWASDGHLFIVLSHRRRGEGDLWGVFIQEGSIFWSNDPLKSLPPNTIILEVQISTCKFGGGHMQPLATCKSK